MRDPFNARDQWVANEKNEMFNRRMQYFIKTRSICRREYDMDSKQAYMTTHATYLDAQAGNEIVTDQQSIDRIYSKTESKSNKNQELPK